MRNVPTDDHEAAAQVLIAYLELKQSIETPNNIGYTFYPQDLEQAARYFRRSLVDWSAAYPSWRRRACLLLMAAAMR